MSTVVVPRHLTESEIALLRQRHIGIGYASDTPRVQHRHLIQIPLRGDLPDRALCGSAYWFGRELPRDPEKPHCTCPTCRRCLKIWAHQRDSMTERSS